MLSEQCIYSVFPGEKIPEDLWEKCSELFSNHYGVWGPMAGEKLTGKRVKKTSKGLKEQLLFPGTKLAVAFLDEVLVGHAFSCTFIDGNHSLCVWITQLVVHSNYRNQGIAQHLCAISWGTKSNAWGLASSHPFAVRALETSTQRLCDPKLIKEYAPIIWKSCPVPYIKNSILKFEEESVLIDTKYFVDHEKVMNIVSELGDSWKLGKLLEGMEYIAITFQFQPQDNNKSRNQKKRDPTN